VKRPTPMRVKGKLSNIHNPKYIPQDACKKQTIISTTQKILHKIL